MNFKDEMKQKVAQIEIILDEYLPAQEGLQKTVLTAMNTTVKAGGKRLRPMLINETYQMFGGKGDIVKPFMAAIEMIHTYSLIHDDLPALDNDDYRRGQKTCHIVYGEDMAILAGDALLNYAYEVATKAFDLADQDEMMNVVEAVKILARKPGIYGMIGGQVADVELEGTPLSMEQILFIHKNKTSALIEACMMIGAVLAGASKEDVLKMEECGEYIGLAFQIQDDILDLTGDEEEIGKPVGSDEKNHKTTYVTLKGLERSQRDVEDISKKAIDILEKYDNIKQLSGEPIYDVYEKKPILCDGVEIVGPEKEDMLHAVAKLLDNREGDTIDGETVVNATSLQVAVKIGSHKMLLCGDSSFAAIEDKLSEYDCIQLPHHGKVKQAEEIFESKKKQTGTLYIISDNTGSTNGGSDKLNTKAADSRTRTRKATLGWGWKWGSWSGFNKNVSYVTTLYTTPHVEITDK